MTSSPFTTKSSFDFTTPKKELVKELVKCDVSNQVFHIKNVEQDSCLKKTNGNSLSLAKCDNFSKDQHWKKIQFPFTDGAHICSGKDCLAVVFTTKLVKSKPEIILQKLDVKIYSYHQQWIYNKKIQKVQNVATNLCLTTMVRFGSPNSSVFSTHKFKIGVDACLEEPNDLQKWYICGY